jgi:lipoprotein NlpI
MIRVRQGEAGPASKDLDSKLRHSEDAEEWLVAIGRLLLGQTTEADLFHVLEEEISRHTPSHQCAAYFFAGVKRSLDNDRPGAAELWKRCLALPVYSHSELDSARLHLKEVVA